MGKHQYEAEGRSWMVIKRELAPYTRQVSEAVSRDGFRTRCVQGYPLVIT